MLRKSFSLLMLVVAIQFSQTFGAPHEEFKQDESTSQPEIYNDGNPEENLSHMLTKEEELRILQKVPEFTETMQAMETLPDGIYDELKNFLESTVPRMPPNNLFTLHFKNAATLVHLFERLVKAARTDGAVFTPQSRAVFQEVHKAVPAFRSSVDEFNGFMKSAMGSLTNQGNGMVQPYTERVDVALGSESLPVNPNQEGSANHFSDNKDSE